MDKTISLALARLEDLVNRAAKLQQEDKYDLARLLLIEAESMCRQIDSGKTIITLPALHN